MTEIEIGRGDVAPASALTESDAPAAVTGGSHVAQSVNLTATATAAAAGTSTEIRRETGTENGPRKTKVKENKCILFVQRILLV